MAIADITTDMLSAYDQRAQLRRAVIASTIGTTIEWYDFNVYGVVTALVFAKLYFPKSDPLVGALQAFVIFFVGFAARPIGAFIFGHYGDRIGRKATLIVTLLLTGIATFAVGLVPTYGQIGIWGALILTTLRFIQGVGVGGEWGGSVLLAMEWARTNAHRGFIASWPQFGAPAGLFLANLAVLVFSAISGDQFLVWGWRIPFLLSIIMVAIGLYIRLGIFETPVFRRLIAEEQLARAPSIEVIKCQPKELILGALARMGEQGSGTVYVAYIFTYGTVVLGASRNFLLTGLLTTSFLGFLWVTVAGHLSDRIGRRRMYMIGGMVTGIDLSGHRAVADPDHDIVRPAGGADRRVLRATAALQRRGDRLPSRLDRRWRPCAIYRGGIVRRLSFRLCDRLLYSCLRYHQHRQRSIAERLHQQGRVAGRIRRLADHLRPHHERARRCAQLLMTHQSLNSIFFPAERCRRLKRTSEQCCGRAVTIDRATACVPAPGFVPLAPSL
jgi:MFS family permease